MCVSVAHFLLQMNIFTFSPKNEKREIVKTALVQCCPPFGSLQVTSTDKLVVKQLDYNHQQLLFWGVTEEMYLFAGMGTGIHMAGIPKRRESIRSVMLRYISLETEIGVSSNS